MRTDILKLVRREVRKALGPTGLIGKRGPAKNIVGMVTKSVKIEIKEVARAAAIAGRNISEELGLSQ